MILKLKPIFTVGLATVKQRWTAVNFFNRIIYANPNNDLLSYTGAFTGRYDDLIDSSTDVTVLAGLPLNELRWDGAVSFYNHVVLWKGNTLRWSDLNDAQNWIPVSATSGTGVASVYFGFNQPTAGSTVRIMLDSAPANWVEGTYVKAVYTTDGSASLPTWSQTGGQAIQELNPSFVKSYVNYYSVVGVSKPSNTSVFTINSPQTWGANNRIIYTEGAPNFGVGNIFRVQNELIHFSVAQEYKKTGFVGVLATGFTRPALDVPVDITFTATPVGLAPGDYISIAPNNSTPSRPGQDIYRVIGADTDLKTVTLQNFNIGTNQVATHAAGDNVIFQPLIVTEPLDPILEGLITINPYTEIPINASALLVDAHQAVLRNENLSGANQQGETIPQGIPLIPLTANEAGQYRGAGGEDRGPILACFQLGDLLYICRKRGIQTMQYEGRPSIFVIRDEISDEGLLGKYLWVKIGADEAYFWGHREMYKLSGTQIEPVAQQVSKQMLREEFDFSRLDEYLMYHNEKDKEIWTIYRPKSETDPNKGNLKIMIYNYIEDSCVFDEWDEDINGVTAVGGLNLEDGSRATVVGVLNNQITTANDKFLVYGEIDSQPVYGFLGRAIRSEAVTADLDFQDAMAWKYIDTIRLDISIKNPLQGRPFRLWVQLGGRDNLDSNIRWTEGQWVDVSGSGNVVTRVNQRVGGRYITVKFLAEQAGIQWKIASYTLSGRLGGTY
jgi:hypothetical protein